VNKIIQEDLDYITNFPLDWNKLKNKNILIAGANGFIPAYIVETLLHLNDKYNLDIKIIALVRNKEKAEKRFKNNKNLYLLVQDVCNTINYNNKIDIIIHAASQASPKYYSVDPVGTMNANYLGTNNLLKLGIKNNIENFLFISSGEVYGETDKIPISEKDYGYIDINNVRNCYCEAKRASETLCISYLKQYNSPIKIVRPFHTYGPGLDLDDGRVFADFIKNILNKEDIILHSAGRKTRCFCYLSDAITGIFTVLLNGKVGEEFNISNPKEEISIFGLATKLTKIFPELNLNIVQKELPKGYLETTIERNKPDTTKANTLGWYPKISIQEGFYRTISYFRNI